MALVSMTGLMQHAFRNKYAVGYFESWNMESVLAVVDAAEQTRSPVIIGFGGQFIGSVKRKIRENIYHYGHLGRIIAQEARVPVALLLNEAQELPMLFNGLEAGFNAVMYESHDSTLEELVKINKDLVKEASKYRAAVEAEIGRLPDADIASDTISAGCKTNPDEAEYFVRETGVDALAVSVGNVHLLENGKASLDFELIRHLARKIPVPLVLHGGTGITDEDMREAISLGMCKVNVGTILKRVYLTAIQKHLKTYDVNRINPHDIIGLGGEMDMLSEARNGVMEEVVRFIRILGSENKAGLI